MTTDANIPRTIVLTGPMGAGKSGTGRRLAAALERPFIDADDAIEAAAGRTIAEIFEQDGEPAFRALEEQVCLALIRDESPAVIALGGGAFMNEAIRKACEAPHVRSVYIRALPETSWERIQASQGAEKRPLLHHPDPVGRLQALFEVRDPIYKLAAFTLHTDGNTKEESLETLLQYLHA